MSLEESFDLEPYLFQFLEGEAWEHPQTPAALPLSAVADEESISRDADMTLIWERGTSGGGC